MQFMDWLKGLTGKLGRPRCTSRVGGCGGGFLGLLAFPAPRDAAVVASLSHRLRALQWGSCGWVNVKLCTSSGMDGAKGPCFSFCMPLVPSYLLGFLCMWK